MFATLERIETITPHITSFWFQPERPLDFVAGQYTQMYLPHPGTDNRGDKRWFTISSSPTEKLFSITCKFAGASPSSSFKKHLIQLPLGSRIQFAEPMGDFILPKDKTIPLLFVAGGIGVTPMLSMISYLHLTDEKRNVHLVYGARGAEELAFLEIFREYGLPLSLTVSRPVAGWTGRAGHITAQHVLQEMGDSERTVTYVAGPEPFVETFNDELQALGVPSNRIVTDFFLGYPEI